MISELIGKLTDEWSESLRSSGVVLKKPLTALVAASMQGKDRKVNFLIFCEGEARPVLILKVAGSPFHQAKLWKEYRSIVEVSAFEKLRGTIPSPIGLYRVRNHLVMVEKFIQGTPLSILLRRRERISLEQVRQDLLVAHQWLMKLQEATRTDMKQSFKNGALCGSEVMVNQLPWAFRSDLADLMKRFGELQFPLVGSHGDYWPGNILRNDSSFGVVDWEGFQRCSSPLRDAFVFITTYARTFPWNGWKWLSPDGAFRMGFLEENWFSTVVREYFRNILSRLSLPPESSHFLFSSFLLEMTSEESMLNGKTGQWGAYLRAYAGSFKNSILEH